TDRAMVMVLSNVTKAMAYLLKMYILYIMDINLLVNLSARAWALPLLACMHRGVAGRQAALIHATGAGRTAFRQSLDHLLEMKLLERNPGHGHPLRPEFRLTALGARVAYVADQVEQLVPGEEQQVLLRRAWTLPVLSRLEEPMRFTEIKRGLPTITDRALSLSLQRLEQARWLQRDVDTEARPPRAIYAARDEGFKIGRLMAA
ncbi:MAG: winged helix-turn-helix transcriptional regulator, partial [Pseudomonadota bacterium]